MTMTKLVCWFWWKVKISREWYWLRGELELGVDCCVAVLSRTVFPGSQSVLNLCSTGKITKISRFPPLWVMSVHSILENIQIEGIRVHIRVGGSITCSSGVGGKSFTSQACHFENVIRCGSDNIMLEKNCYPPAVQYNDLSLSWNNLYLPTHIVAHCPVLIIVKVDFSFSVCSGEKSMGEDPSRTVEWQIVSMPIPTQTVLLF